MFRLTLQVLSETNKIKGGGFANDLNSLYPLNPWPKLLPNLKWDPLPYSAAFDMYMSI